MRTALRVAVLGLTLSLLVLGVVVIGSQPTGNADLSTDGRNAAASPTSPSPTSPSPTGASSPNASQTPAQPEGDPSASARVPVPDHIVVVMLENKHRNSLIGSSNAPYLNALADRGANMSESYGVTHPSQPNYIALLSGSTQGVTRDTCPQRFGKTKNLASQLLAAGLTFTGYSEDLPKAGYTGCSSGEYRRKHNSWVDFANVPASANQPFSAFPSDYGKLPTVAFVSPDMCSDMHDCSIATGDRWMKDKLDDYARWAQTHNSLLVVTFDENAGGTVNQIPTLLVGEKVRPGTYAEPMNHYTLLRTIEDAYGLPALANAKQASPLQTIWTTSPATAVAPVGVSNGSFELGVAGWAVSGSTTTTTSSRHGGSLVARAGSSQATTGDSILSQTVTVPAGRSTLRVAWLGRCDDVRSKAWTTIMVKPGSGPAITVLPRTCRKSGGWRAASVAVTAGKTYTVQLVNHDDGKKSTPNRTYFDDVTLR